MKNLLHELGHVKERYVIHCDNQSAIHLTKNPTFQSQTKHIDYRYYWIRNTLEDEELQQEKVHINDNWSDMVSKAISTKKLTDCCGGAELSIPLTNEHW